MAPKDMYKKEKSTDLSTPWSDWQRHGDGYYFASRYNAAGEVEYQYPGTQTSHDPQTIPRSPAPNPGYYSHSTSQSYGTDSNSYTTSSTTEAPISSYGNAATSVRTAPVPYYQTSGSSGYTGANNIPGIENTVLACENTSGHQLNDKSLPISRSVSSYDHSHGESAGLVSSFQRLTVSSSLTQPSQGSYDTTSTAAGDDFSPEAASSSQHPRELNSSYREIDSSDNKFWKVGRVFAVLWTEPAHSVPQGVLSSHGSQYVETFLGGAAYSEIRRFVILQDGYGNCICSPIHSYGGQATLKENLAEPEEHAIIYTSSRPPDEYWYNVADSVVAENLTKDPIKVKRHNQSNDCDLRTKSRLNYSKVYTVEKNLKVLNIGMVENIASLLDSSFVKRKTPISRPRHSSSRSDPNKRRDKDKDRDRGRDKDSHQKRRTKA